MEERGKRHQIFRKIGKRPGVHGKEFLLCAFAALCVLLLFSKSSWLYPFNDWPDVNMFFTMGKGMLHGKVPYVDLAEQKGPYVFLAGAVGYLLSNTGFYGYFLLELLSFSFFLFYAARIIALYTDFPSIWILPLLGAGIGCAKSFVHGGSLEELCLGFFAYGIYSLLRFLRSPDGSMPKGTLLANGVIAGILLWSKFTLLGLHIVWAVAVGIVFLRRKKYRRLLEGTGLFLGGMAAATIPWLIYFGWHHAIGDWFQAYLWDNIFGYTQKGHASLSQRLAAAVGNALDSLKDRDNRTYSLWVIAGGILFILLPGKKASWREKISVAFMGFGMSLGIFIGGTKHDYYGLPLSSFGIFGILCAVLFAGELAGKLPAKLIYRLSQKKRLLAAGCFLLFLGAGCWLGFLNSPNTYLLRIEREEMPQYRFAGIMQESGDTSMLNYGFLDGGFYTVLGEVPDTKYYCTLNVNPSLSLASQNTVLERGGVEWVVTWKAYMAEEEELRRLPVVSESYTLTDYQYFYFEGDMRTYALYRYSGTE
nr:hypothetical protein [uncultured Acetatifactor sp.]